MGKIILTQSSSIMARLKFEVAAKVEHNRTQKLLSVWTKHIKALLGVVYPPLATFSLQHELLDKDEGVVSGVARTLINASNLRHIHALWNT